MASKKKIAVFGGEGFIGRNLTDVLSKDHQCFSFDLRESFFAGSKATFKSVDPYNDNIPGRFDTVINLIDNRVELSDIENAEKKMLSNIGAMEPEHIIVFSSASIYMSPDSEYAKRKLLIEGIYQKYCQENKIGLSILRLFNIFGPYQFPNRKGSLVANILCNHFAGKPVEINDLQAKRDFIYSKDMAKCVEQIIDRKIFGSDDLATNKMTTIGELIVKFNQVLPTEIKIVDKNIQEIETCPAASSRIIELIKPTEAEQSLKETVDFYERNWQLIGEK